MRDGEAGGVCERSVRSRLRNSLCSLWTGIGALRGGDGGIGCGLLDLRFEIVAGEQAIDAGRCRRPVIRTVGMSLHDELGASVKHFVGCAATRNRNPPYPEQ